MSRLIRTTTVLSFSIAICIAVSVPARAQTDNSNRGRRAAFTGIVSFGDSLSDVGNLFADTGFPPPEYYFEGRFSNGPIWVEYLACEMRMRPRRIKNYAYGGATTGRDNLNDPLVFPAELPGLQDEIDNYFDDIRCQRAGRRTLYTIFAGANDMFAAVDPVAAVPQAVENTVLAVQRLHDAGARRIMVFNLPDLGLTPFGLAADPLALSFLTAHYNAQLEIRLDQIEAEGYRTVRVDVAGLMQEINSDPSAYGLGNVTDQGLLSGGTGAGYLFWDEVHPTTDGHTIIADEAVEALIERFGHIRSVRRGR